MFAWLRDGADGARRCLEAQVMDLADDVAYSVHDVEDAIVGGHLDPRALADSLRGRPGRGAGARLVPAGAADDEVAAALQRLRALPGWLASFDRSHPRARRAQGHDERADRPVLVGGRGRDRVAVRPGCAEAVHRGRRRAAVDAVEIATLKGIAAVYVMTAAARRPVYVQQRELLTELASVVADGAPDVLEPSFAEVWRSAPDDGARLRVVVDQVASLTDTSATSWHARLTAR